MEFNLSQFELLDTAVLTVQTADESDDLLIDGKQVKITLRLRERTVHAG